MKWKWRCKPEKANKWIQPIRRGYKLACCDCGLIHSVDFRIFKGRVQFRVRRADGLTRIARKMRGITVKHP